MGLLGDALHHESGSLPFPVESSLDLILFFGGILRRILVVLGHRMGKNKSAAQAHNYDS